VLFVTHALSPKLIAWSQLMSYVFGALWGGDFDSGTYISDYVCFADVI
jgi:hypothetical protein